MLDEDLGKLYDVSTGRLNEQVQRNIERFPNDFMFQLTCEEANNLKSQNAISRWGGRRKRPYVFTEQGVAMLSGILRSKRAVAVNIQIMRVFVKLRQIISSHKELALKINKIEERLGQHDIEIHTVFEAIRKLMQPPEKPKNKIGFLRD